MVLHRLSSSSLDNPDVCIIDNVTTHSNLWDGTLFHRITPSMRLVATIDGTSQIEEGHGPTSLKVPYGTKIYIASTIYVPHGT